MKRKIDKQVEELKKKSTTKKGLKEMNSIQRGELMPRPTVFQNKKRRAVLDKKKAIHYQLREM